MSKNKTIILSVTYILLVVLFVVLSHELRFDSERYFAIVYLRRYFIILIMTVLRWEITNENEIGGKRERSEFISIPLLFVISVLVGIPIMNSKISSFEPIRVYVCIQGIILILLVAIVEFKFLKKINTEINPIGFVMLEIRIVSMLMLLLRCLDFSWNYPVVFYFMLPIAVYFFVPTIGIYDFVRNIKLISKIPRKQKYIKPQEIRIEEDLQQSN